MAQPFHTLDPALKKRAGWVATMKEALPVIDATKYRAEGRFLRVYDELLTAKTPYVVNFGGGASGKSYAQAIFFVRRCLRKKHKLLVLRRYGTTLEDSVIDQFREVALPFWNLTENLHYTYNISKRRLKFNNGSQIIFRGLDNAEKLKSISGITLVWLEEATEVSKSEFQVFSDRIRGEPQIYLTYNPISERHWLRERFHHKDDPFRPIDDRTTLIFSTYLDNLKWVGKKYIDDMERYRLHDPDHYAIYGLGKFGILRPENPYFSVWKRAIYVRKTTYNPFHPVYVSCDFNIKNSFLVSQHYDNRIDYLEAWHGDGDLKTMCQKLALKYGRNEIYFTGDGTANNGSAFTDNNMSGWANIKQHMEAFGAMRCDYRAVPRSNLDTAASRRNCNALLGYFGERISVDEENCPLLIDDIERMRAEENGKLDKKDATKHNYGHIGDCFRYDLCNFEASTLGSIAA